jgi:hypothetical protein
MSRYDGYFRPDSNRQAEYNSAMSAIVRRQMGGEITVDQAKLEMRRVTDEQFPEFGNRPDDDKWNDNWDGLGPQWGGKRSKDESIPASAKAVTKHRTACGAKMSDKDIARFWEKINVRGANECWNWKSSTRGSLGYGQFRLGDKICDAHRIALELYKGPLKKGRYILHDCDSPKCCNPRHLTAGTQKGNMDDMTEKGRGDN